MIKAFIISAAAGAVLLGLGGAAFAAAGQFDNMCAESLAQHKPVQTDCSINGLLHGKTYCFGSDQAKAEFMKAPDANLKKAEAYYKSEHKG
jgi:hypothetical protein